MFDTRYSRRRSSLHKLKLPIIFGNIIVPVDTSEWMCSFYGDSSSSIKYKPCLKFLFLSANITRWKTKKLWQIEKIVKKSFQRNPNFFPNPGLLFTVLLLLTDAYTSGFPTTAARFPVSTSSTTTNTRSRSESRWTAAPPSGGPTIHYNRSSVGFSKRPGAWLWCWTIDY